MYVKVSEFSSLIQATMASFADSSSNLKITKSGLPLSPAASSTITYTVNVTNLSANVATTTKLVDTLPAGTAMNPGEAFAVSTHGTCTFISTTKTECTLNNLNPGETSTTTIVATVASTAIGTLTNKVTAYGVFGTFNLSAVTATTANNVAAGTDLRITKTATPTPVVSGGSLTYTLWVTNLGPGASTNVTVTDVLPPGVTLSSATPSQGGCSGNPTVTCNLGSLSINASSSIVINVTVNSTSTTGSITNIASVTGSESDPVTANNSATIVTSVLPAPPVPGVSFWGIVGIAIALSAGVFWRITRSRRRSIGTT